MHELIADELRVWWIILLKNVQIYTMFKYFGLDFFSHFNMGAKEK